MEGLRERAVAAERNGAPLVRSAHLPGDVPAAAERLAEALGEGPFALVILFVTPETDVSALALGAQEVFGPVPVIGCTTAGEISAEGYTEGEVVAVALPAAHFHVRPILIGALADLDREELIGRLIRERDALARERPDWGSEFAFLMVDGLSTREDELASTLAAGLGPVPLFGGSAADGVRFRETFVIHGADVLRDAAVLALVRSDCRVRVFNLDHFRPTDQRMVVTEADPARRIVRRINAEPAAQEYAGCSARIRGSSTASPSRPIRWWCGSAASITSAPSARSRRTAISSSFPPSTRGWCLRWPNRRISSGI